MCLDLWSIDYRHPLSLGPGDNHCTHLSSGALTETRIRLRVRVGLRSGLHEDNTSPFSSVLERCQRMFKLRDQADF